MCAEEFDCVSGFCVDLGNSDGVDGNDEMEGDGDGDTGDGDGDGDGDVCVRPLVTPITPKVPDPSCLPNVPCVDDSNCPAGHLCNTAMQPPACEQIYCGTSGTPCSDSGLCKDGLCHEGVCKPCDICGDECEVDFDSSPDHCGCCDNPEPSGGVC